MSGKVRIHNLSVSLDGFATGEDQTLEAPMGHSGHGHLAWIFGTRFATAMMGGEGGTNGVDDAFAQQWGPGIGAEIMGAYKFGPPGWQDDPDWKGWWGPNPPFHTPTFVLTHKPKPSIEMEGGTTFHFLDATPAKALEVALEAALGQDVRIGGGPTVAREFIAAGLVDHIHIVQAPVLFGRGVRLWDGLEGIEKDYDVEAVTSPSGVTHFFLERLPLGAGTGGGEEEDDAPRSPWHAPKGDTEYAADDRLLGHHPPSTAASTTQPAASAGRKPAEGDERIRQRAGAQRQHHLYGRQMYEVMRYGRRQSSCPSPSQQQHSTPSSLTSLTCLTSKEGHSPAKTSFRPEITMASRRVM